MVSSWKYLAAFTLLCAVVLAAALNNNDSQEVSIFEGLSCVSLASDSGVQILFISVIHFRTMFLRIQLQQHFSRHIVTTEMDCVIRLMKMLKDHHKVR